MVLAFFRGGGLINFRPLINPLIIAAHTVLCFMTMLIVGQKLEGQRSVCVCGGPPKGEKGLGIIEIALDWPSLVLPCSPCGARTACQNYRRK